MALKTFFLGKYFWRHGRCVKCQESGGSERTLEELKCDKFLKFSKFKNKSKNF